MALILVIILYTFFWFCLPFSSLAMASESSCLYLLGEGTSWSSTHRHDLQQELSSGHATTLRIGQTGLNMMSCCPLPTPTFSLQKVIQNQTDFKRHSSGCFIGWQLSALASSSSIRIEASQKLFLEQLLDWTSCNRRTSPLSLKNLRKKTPQPERVPLEPYRAQFKNI